MKPTAVLPDDPALPGLAPIRAVGLARAIPALALDHGPVAAWNIEVDLRATSLGVRADRPDIVVARRRALVDDHLE